MIIISEKTASQLVYLSVIIFVILIILLAFNALYIPKASGKDYSELVINRQPIQTETDSEAFFLKINRKPLKITPLADFDITGIVVSTKKYHSGFDAKVVPLDIGIVWGDVAKEEYLRHIHFEQIVRFLRYRFTGAVPFDYDYLNKNVANIHVMSANSKLKRVLNSIKKNDKVQLKGYLIHISSINDSRYYRRSSLTRDDTGDGACEVMWVNYVRVNNKIYY